MKVTHQDFITSIGKLPTWDSAFNQRYPNIPSDYLIFLQGFVSIVNESDTAWFNSMLDFSLENKDSEFAWNEFELQSLETFEGDEVMQASVREFWDRHLPVLLSVKNGYAHFSIGVAEDNFGQLFFGEEPEFEEVVRVSDSFIAFLTALNSGELLDEFKDYL